MSGEDTQEEVESLKLDPSEPIGHFCAVFKAYRKSKEKDESGKPGGKGWPSSGTGGAAGGNSAGHGKVSRYDCGTLSLTQSRPYLALKVPSIKRHCFTCVKSCNQASRCQDKPNSGIHPVVDGSISRTVDLARLYDVPTVFKFAILVFEDIYYRQRIHLGS